MLPIAVDAMGGDKAPAEIVAGAKEAAATLGVPVLLVGRPDEIGDPGDLEVIAASEVIAMDADAGASVRRMKDSSLVRAAEAVRDGRASAMVERGQHRGHDGQRPAAHGPHQGRGPSRDRDADPGARRHADGDARRRRQRRVQRRVARAVRPDGRGLRPRPLRHRAPAGGAAVDRRGGDQGQRAGQGDPQAAGRSGLDRHAPARPSSATSRVATS